MPCILMNRFYSFIFLLFLCFIMHSCDNEIRGLSTPNKSAKFNERQINLLSEINPDFEKGVVNAVVEIPAGTIEKWEVHKESGQVSWEKTNNKGRVVNYLGYPGNYGMIPQTCLTKENGGDGDPLDIIILGPPLDRGAVVRAKIIGVLYLLDNGEQDHKLIAVASNSPLCNINSIAELNQKYNGISRILEIWFSNYKGPNKMISNGFGTLNNAIEMLNLALDSYTLK